MESAALNRLQIFYQWSDQLSEVSNGGVLVLAVLLALFALAFLAAIFAAAEDEERWKAEKEALTLENASLRGAFVGAQGGGQNTSRPAVTMAGETGRKEGKKMGTVKEARQMVKEIGLLRALVMVSLAAILGKMLKTSWEQIKHHFLEEQVPPPGN